MNGFSSLQISDTQTLAEEEYDDTIPQTNDQSHVSRIPKESQDFMQDHDPESAIFEADLFNNDESIEVEQLSKLPVWFGDLSPVGFDRRYLALRDKLSDAAYSGQFETLFQVLADVEHAYAQSWANAPRLSKQCLVFGVLQTIFPSVRSPCRLMRRKIYSSHSSSTMLLKDFLLFISEANKGTSLLNVTSLIPPLIHRYQ